MKKKILLVALAVALLLGGIGGGVACDTNADSPELGDKLIGVGNLGETGPEDEYVGFSPYFTITNPNSTNDITIKYLAVMDHEGNVVVEGTPQQLNLPGELGPHDIWEFALGDFVEIPQLDRVPAPLFTVEITWAGQGPRELIGWARQVFAMDVEIAGSRWTNVALTAVQMVNFSR